MEKITLYKSMFKTIDGENEMECLLRTLGYKQFDAEAIKDITLKVEIVSTSR